MKYSNELLESGLLNFYFPKASFFAVCDWLNKKYIDVKLCEYGGLIAVHNKIINNEKDSKASFIGYIGTNDLKECIFTDRLGLIIYDPKLDNQFDSANQYD